MGSLPSRRADKREIRALRRRLYRLRRNLACIFGCHNYVKEDRYDKLGMCRYCYTPNVWIIGGGGLTHRLERWRAAVSRAEEDGVIRKQRNEEDDH